MFYAWSLVPDGSTLAGRLAGLYVRMDMDMDYGYRCTQPSARICILELS